MAQAKKKYVKLTTPWGKAGFVGIRMPSTKFNADGEFSCRLMMDPGPETDAFIQQLQELYDQAYEDNLAAARVDKPKLAELKKADPPFKHPTDEDTGEPLPGYQINARLKKVLRTKDGTLIRENPAPALVDAKNQPVRHDPGPGSEIRMIVKAGGFFTSALGSGVSLQLVGVQVRDFIPFGGEKADFEDVDGFTVDTFEPTQMGHTGDQPKAGGDTVEKTADVGADDEGEVNEW